MRFAGGPGANQVADPAADLARIRTPAASEGPPRGLRLEGPRFFKGMGLRALGFRV